MSGKWIAALLVIVAVGVVVTLVIVNSNDGEVSRTETGEVKGYVWDGELAKGAIREGNGTWMPFYK